MKATGNLMVFKCLTILAFVNSVFSSIPRPRGVSVASAGLYPPKDTFVCLDGRRTIDFLRVNDDYCDCDDGSDEPGTSACPNSSFYCTNSGHKPKIIPSSFVNDGVCDCCDTSDEYASGKNCENNCIELGKHERVLQQRYAELIKAGNKMRQDLIKTGKAKREEQRTRLKELERAKHEANLIKNERETVKLEIESKEKVALDNYRKMADQLEQERKEKEEYELWEEGVQKFKLFDTNNDNLVEIAELQVDLIFDADNDGVVTVDEVKDFFQGDSSVELDKFSKEIWPRIKAHISMKEEVKIDSLPVADAPETEDIENEAHDIDDTETEEADIEDGETEEHENEDTGADVEEHEDEEKYDERPQDYNRSEPPQYDAETQRLIEEANQARNLYSEAERQLNEIDTDLKTIQSDLSMDFGPEDEYGALKGECLKYTDREYVYTLCPFEKAKQQPKNGGAETNLGDWDDWNGSPNKYSKMMYNKGATCWNGPSRSVEVTIQCGLENKIISVAEPNRCEYVFAMETPAACDMVSDGSTLHDEL